MTSQPGFGGGSNSVGVRTAAIGEAWKVVQQNLGTWIVTAIIYLVVLSVFSFIQRAVGPQVNPDGTIGGSNTMGFLVSMISAAVGGFLLGGAFRMALKQLRGETTSPGDLFSGTDILPSLMGAGVLQTLVILIGLVLCILPGLYIAPLLLLAIPIVADQKVGAIDGIGRSFNALKPHWGGAFLLSLILGLIIIAGTLCFLVGLLIAWPILIVTIAIVYNDFFGGNSNASNVNTNLYPPIPHIPQ